ncbi:MAG: DNA topoisomerase III [bacterium]
MGKTLVIAEKPSAARDIARALGGLSQRKNFYEGDEHVVTSAVGHLLELVAPEGVEVKRGKWSLANLPVLPDHFDLQPIAKSETQLKLVGKLYRRKDVVAVINACDAGREGELIFHYLIRHFNGKKPVRRLWLQSMTPAAIRAGFADLRAEADLLGLQRAAVCRSESDWLVGINATRAMTALNSSGGGFSLTTVGRVQTPTLAILVDREKEIQIFEPRAYWEVHAQFEIESGRYEGRWAAPAQERKARKAAAKNESDGADPHGIARPERIWDLARAEDIVARCLRKRGDATEVTKPASQSPPLLFDLTSLQREANRRFGFSARATLAIAQALYERHKALTYPRTDSRALPEDYPAMVNKVMRALSERNDERIDESKRSDDDNPATKPIAHWARIALDSKYIRAGDKRIFNNARVSDHFAIVPTGEAPGKLKEQERRIYDLVTRTFIAAFFPPARFENTLRTTVVEGEAFETRGKVLIESGWLQVMGRKDATETLPPLAVADGQAAEQAAVVEVEATPKHTKPAPRYSEATLLSALEGAGKSLEDGELREAMKGRGLGTPATRAAIIEELIRNRYVLRDARELIPTPKANTLLRLLRALKIDELTAAELTGEWEKRLKEIESNEFSADDFMRHIREMTERIVAAARDCDVDQIPGEYATLQSPCPKCGGEVRENYRKFVCCACDFSIWKSIAGREFSSDEAAALLRDRRIGPLQGFRSRIGREFSAELIVKDDFSVRFDFDDADDTGDINPEACEKLGACPKCAAPVLDTPRRYLCRNAIGDKPACDFAIGKHILSRPIAPDEAAQLLTQGKTALLEGFVSKKNNRKFAAHLTMDLTAKTGKLGFEFPLRKGAADNEKNAKASKKKAAKKKVAKKKTAKSKPVKKP